MTASSHKIIDNVLETSSFAKWNKRLDQLDRWIAYGNPIVGLFFLWSSWPHPSWFLIADLILSPFMIMAVIFNVRQKWQTKLFRWQLEKIIKKRPPDQAKPGPATATSQGPTGHMHISPAAAYRQQIELRRKDN